MEQTISLKRQRPANSQLVVVAASAINYECDKLQHRFVAWLAGAVRDGGKGMSEQSTLAAARD
jgi:hypothetical protein